jgi:UDP-N-acetyl-D-mannosaminuronic acid dehydrogenase
MTYTTQVRDVSPRAEASSPVDVVVVGLGYVGLTLAVAFAQAGLTVAGFEVDPRRRQALQEARLPFREPGLESALTAWTGRRLLFIEALPAKLPPAVVLCVGTPVEEGTHQVLLQYLRSAIDDVAPRIEAETLLVLRSTVPVGTTRRMIFEPLRKRIDEPLVAYSPERTIQGVALAELRSLPQVVGGTPRACERAAELFRRITPQIVEVSSLEVAELVKLVNNCHTDLIYGFGNEVAMIASAVGVDAGEVIKAANLDYPRPDLSHPGFVGGSCLTKDPYILLASARQHGYDPPMVAAARELNERVPVHVAERVLNELERAIDPATATVVVSGIAYKGRPETDDARGSAVPRLVEVLRPRVHRLLGHDFVVDHDTIAAFGLEPCKLREGCVQANALIILNNHPSYSQHGFQRLGSDLKPPRVLYDLWGVVQPADGHLPPDAVHLTLADERSRA